MAIQTSFTDRIESIIRSIGVGNLDLGDMMGMRRVDGLKRIRVEDILR